MSDYIEWNKMNSFLIFGNLINSLKFRVKSLLYKSDSEFYYNSEDLIMSESTDNNTHTEKYTDFVNSINTEYNLNTQSIEIDTPTETVESNIVSVYTEGNTITESITTPTEIEETHNIQSDESNRSGSTIPSNSIDSVDNGANSTLDSHSTELPSGVTVPVVVPSIDPSGVTSSEPSLMPTSVINASNDVKLITIFNLDYPTCLTKYEALITHNMDSLDYDEIEVIKESLRQAILLKDLEEVKDQERRIKDVNFEGMKMKSMTVGDLEVTSFEDFIDLQSDFEAKAQAAYFIGTIWLELIQLGIVKPTLPRCIDKYHKFANLVKLAENQSKEVFLPVENKQPGGDKYVLNKNCGVKWSSKRKPVLSMTDIYTEMFLTKRNCPSK